MSDENQAETPPSGMPKDIPIGAKKTRIRNLLNEFGFDCFILCGYIDGYAFEIKLAPTEMHQNAIDRLYEQKYQRDFAVTEYETEWTEAEDDD